MRQYFLKSILILAPLFSINPAFAGTLVLGLGLEFVDGEFNNEAFDGGWGFHAGYEFHQWYDWNLGVMFEYMNGWYTKDELDVEGEMTYDSKSLFATARLRNWPIMFKAGFVNADYSILQETYSDNFRDKSGTGFGYGVALVFGGEAFRVDLLDIKKIKIGNESFTSYGLSVAFFGGGGSFK